MTGPKTGGRSRSLRMECMNLNGQIRALGFYLIACSIYQAVLYTSSNGVASILDPRLGFFVLPGGETWPPRMDWASAIWLSCLGLALTLGGGKPLLVTYLFSELLLAFPSGAYIIISLAGRAGHLTATGAPLAILIGIIIAFTVLPVTLAVYLLGKRA